METLFLSVLADTLIEASYMFGYRQKGRGEGFVNTKLMSASQEAFDFVAGTGLNIMIREYKMGYDPDRIRELFYIKFGYHEAV